MKQTHLFGLIDISRLWPVESPHNCFALTTALLLGEYCFVVTSVGLNMCIRMRLDHRPSWNTLLLGCIVIHPFTKVLGVGPVSSNSWVAKNTTAITGGNVLARCNSNCQKCLQPSVLSTLGGPVLECERPKNTISVGQTELPLRITLHL